MRNSEYFRSDEEKSYKRAMAMFEELKQANFRGTPCPLLHSQLREASLFAKKFSQHADELTDLLEKD